MKVLIQHNFLPQMISKGSFQLFLFCCLSALSTVKSQVSIKDSSINLFHLGVAYSYNLPGGDLSARFGNHNTVSIHFNYKLKNNFNFAVHGAYLFGKEISEPGFLQNLATSNGLILGANGAEAAINFAQRGWLTYASAGYIWSFNAPNPNSGIQFNLGLGYMWHKIKIEDRDNVVFQFQDDYIKGYDRLTGGLLANVYLGYRFFGNNKWLNWFAGIEYGQAFTQSLRKYNYDTQSPDLKNRQDSYLGFKVGWMILFHKKAPKEFYFR